MNVGCFELCVPGERLDEKLKALELYGIWIEIANKGKREDLDILGSFSVEAKSVQAYRLHDLSLISSDLGIRKKALRHVKKTIDLANDIGAERVITVPSYGHSFIKEPVKKAVDVFEELCGYALDSGVQILVEALSPEKTSFLPSLDEVASLVNMVSFENIWLLADTGHLNNMEVEVLTAIQEFGDLVKEIHLKGENSGPPSKGSIPFKDVLDTYKEIPMCLEYRSNYHVEDFQEAIRYLRNYLH
ncbi:MAG: sugar phosphate isomerase/epimerase family protein [Candidatus Hydrothermarchaeales archaeon]